MHPFGFNLYEMGRGLPSYLNLIFGIYTHFQYIYIYIYNLFKFFFFFLEPFQLDMSGR